MKRASLIILSLLLPHLCLSGGFKLFMKDGSQLECSRRPVFLYGKAVITLDSGRTLTFNHDVVDIKRTRDFNTGTERRDGGGAFTIMETTGTNPTPLPQEEWLQILRGIEEWNRKARPPERDFALLKALQEEKKGLEEELEELDRSYLYLNPLVRRRASPGPPVTTGRDGLRAAFRREMRTRRYIREKREIEGRLREIDAEYERELKR